MFSVARYWRALAVRRKSCIVACGVLPLLIRAALLPLDPIPIPAVHDEFSNLLAAETFALGRLTNPTPPMWIHFETFHEMMTSTYMSMYPPGQGAEMALGKILFGDPWWAVWLRVGVMCAALIWMLYAWLPPAWALLGGVLAVLQFSVAHYWMNSYWGGALAAIGGILVLGSYLRLQKRIRALWITLRLGVGDTRQRAPLRRTHPRSGCGHRSAHLDPRRPESLRSNWLLRIGPPVLAALAPCLIATMPEAKVVTGEALDLPQHYFRARAAAWPTFVFEAVQPRITRTQ